MTVSPLQVGFSASIQNPSPLSFEQTSFAVQSLRRKILHASIFYPLHLLVRATRRACLALPVRAEDAVPGASQPTILYGAAYYHEYMPYDRLDKDVAMMKAAGISVVRMGESTWSLWDRRTDDSSMPGWTVSSMPWARRASR